MRQPRSLVLLGAIFSFTATAAGSLPRGVSPEFASYYEGKSEFACITDASTKLSLSRVNDNTCDCPDGSDEPGTAACAHIDPLSPQQPLPGSPSGSTDAQNALPGFWCVNKGHIGSYVPFSYVNDGACDYDLCCDGSEEFSGVGGVKCENRCAEIGKEHRRLEDEKRKNREKAGNKRRTMAKEAKEMRRRAEVRLAELTEEVKKLEAKKAELERQHAAAELEDRGKVVKGEGGGGKLGVLVGLAKARVNELRTALYSVVEQRNHLGAKVDELETILRKLKEEYNPNFNDEGVKAAVKSFEDYAAREATDVQDQAPDSEIEDEATNVNPDSEIEEILEEDSETSGVNWKEFEEHGDDTDILFNFEAYLPAFLRGLIHDKLDDLRGWLIRNGILADNAKAGTESHLVKAAREAVEAADRELRDKTRASDEEKEDLGKDYGPSDIFRALKGKSTSIEAGEYTYELTWMDKTAQKSKKGHGNTNMGNFVRIDREMADDEERLDGKSLGKGERMVLRYDDGQGCWNGPRRRTDVWLGCAETEEVWRVSEAEKCVYRMEVGTPAACEPEAGEGPRGKDEL
ncbi:Glucosidase 2 subunit beta [Tolypocladium capitatum]|uniref:Glucosidase 2 subunit beta n=1 Tax=Tolypocladium capitatum TaxID=45235 RepID=A0A2K3QCE1_9HYPO|nr:Glucosidase 2 subunit beta [Tolypocladium capitatum]